MLNARIDTNRTMHHHHQQGHFLEGAGGDGWVRRETGECACVCVRARECVCVRVRSDWPWSNGYASSWQCGEATTSAAAVVTASIKCLRDLIISHTSNNNNTVCRNEQRIECDLMWCCYRCCNDSSVGFARNRWCFRVGWGRLAGWLVRVHGEWVENVITMLLFLHKTTDEKSDNSESIDIPDNGVGGGQERDRVTHMVASQTGDAMMTQSKSKSGFQLTPNAWVNNIRFDFCVKQ